MEGIEGFSAAHHITKLPDIKGKNSKPKDLAEKVLKIGLKPLAYNSYYNLLKEESTVISKGHSWKANDNSQDNLQQRLKSN